MTRNHFSYHCVRAARRCEVRHDKVERFQRELLIAYRDFPRSHIVNADEFIWLVLWQPRKTVAEKGVELILEGPYLRMTQTLNQIRIRP
jgi:hypothetical protein